MLTIAGASALSPFRLGRLLAELQSIAPGVHSLQARFVHFVETDRELEAQERAILEQLLEYGPRRAAEHYSGELFLVVPRHGTLSPWSSKATDIAHNCGLGAVRGLERGIAYYVTHACDATRRGARASRRRCTIAWSRARPLVLTSMFDTPGLGSSLNRS